MYKSLLERKLARHKVRRWTKAIEVFLEGLITFMVLSAFAIWAWTVHLLALA